MYIDRYACHVRLLISGPIVLPIVFFYVSNTMPQFISKDSCTLFYINMKMFSISLSLSLFLLSLSPNFDCH